MKTGNTTAFVSEALKKPFNWISEDGKTAYYRDERNLVLSRETKAVMGAIGSVLTLIDTKDPEPTNYIREEHKALADCTLQYAIHRHKFYLSSKTFKDLFDALSNAHAEFMGRSEEN